MSAKRGCLNSSFLLFLLLHFMISIKFSQKYHPIKQKKLLKETNLTVKEISCAGGFLSDMAIYIWQG